MFDCLPTLPHSLEVVVENLERVIQRGVARGELDQSRLTSRISSLPLDLLRHEVIMTRKPVSKELIVEIIDSIFLPLAAVRAAD
jgi:hypothetical protein